MTVPAAALQLEVLSIVVGLFAIAGGAGFLAAAYSMCGRLAIVRDESGWSITKALGRWSRTRRFPSSSIHHIARHSERACGNATIAGLHLLVHVIGRETPIRVAGGLCLEERELIEIQELLSSEIRWPI
jgi:hypothetical protein